LKRRVPTSFSQWAQEGTWRSGAVWDDEPAKWVGQYPLYATTALFFGLTPKTRAIGDVKFQSQRSQTSVFAAVTTPLTTTELENPIFSILPNLTVSGRCWFSRLAARVGVAFEV